MKNKTSVFGKLVYAINILVAFLLVLAYVLPYIPPQKFASLSVLSLGVPLLILLNILFVVYWLVRLKKQIILSFLVLLLGYSHINKLYKLPASNTKTIASDISIMNYNVRLFNLYNWLPNKSVKTDILNVFATENPDVICLQEFHQKEPLHLAGYEKFEMISKGKVKSGQAIFSKFPIINSGSVNFPNTSNNAIYVDVLMKQDTIRIYNLHLQSSGINSDVESLKNENSNQLFRQVSKTFKLQQTQAELFLTHKNKSPYKVIIAGDFNNTAYSYVYKKIKGNYLDAFGEAGSGFGRTYDFKLFPVRIDFILVDPSFKVNTFETFTMKLSDHFPVKASLSLN